MSGGGRRPPSTRRNSPALDSRRSVTPPVRRNINGNAGYAAIIHDAHGRFTSKPADVHVDGSEKLSNSRTGAGKSLEAGSDPLMNILPLDNPLEEGYHVNLGLVQDREQQHATLTMSQGEQTAVFIDDSMLLDDGNVAGGTCAGPVAKASNQRQQDEDMQTSVLPCPQDVCVNAPAQMQERSAHVADEGISVHHGGSYDGCLKAPSSSSDYISAACTDSGGVKAPTMHGNCTQSMGTQGVCLNAPSKKPSGSPIPNVWKKQGVVLLPSLQDLGNPPSQNGAAQLDDEEVKGYVDRFRSALVGRLFGRHFPFSYLNNELHRRWDGFGSFKLLTLSNDCFICLFEEAAARDSVLMAGPWALAGQVLGLDVWTPTFSPSTMHGFVTPIWVRFPGLPLYCWGRNSLTYIASSLGEPIWIDDATAEMSRASYARVCIRADLSKPLVGSVRVLGLNGPFQQLVEYECLATLCFRCGRVGHKDIKCPSLGSSSSKMQTNPLGHSHHATAVPPVTVPRPNHSSLDVAVGTSSRVSRTALDLPDSNIPPAPGDAHPQALKDNDDEFGPWMVVQHRRRKPAQPKRSKLMWVPSSRGSKLPSSPVQKLNNDTLQTFSSPQLQVSTCAANLQEHHALKIGESLEQPMSDDHAALVFSSNSQKNFDNAPARSFAQVNSNRDTKHKIQGSLLKGKQVFYDAGPLIIESHKKRRPSIQSIGEDASSSAAG